MKKRITQLVVCICASMMLLANQVDVYATPANDSSVQDIQNEIDNIEKDIKDLEQQKKDAQKEKDAAQSQLSGVNSEISSISDTMGDLENEIDALNEELVGLLTAIELIQLDIENKTAEIANTEIEYEAAVKEQDDQYAAMKIRIKYMYEQGEMSYLAIFLESQNINDALNKADYIEQLYTYDREMLIKYQETVAYTKQVWDKLEEEKSELETSKYELEEEQAYLEEVEAQLEAEYENYDVLLAQAKKKAASYTAQINQQNKEIKKLEQAEKKKEKEAEAKRKEKEEAQKKAEREAAQVAAQEALEAGDYDRASEIVQTATYDSGSNSNKPSIVVAGSGTGSQIASYALQFVGNPYVPGGTSLTSGADCSGFVMAVYSHFGYKLPRTSYSQSTVGSGVSYSEAKPGDIIYYGGHVGIYIGNGQIVHASTQKTGIKVSPATYRSIVTVRRVI